MDFKHLGTTEHYSKRSKWLCPKRSFRRVLGKLAIIVGTAALDGWARVAGHVDTPPRLIGEAQVEKAIPV